MHSTDAALPAPDVHAVVARACPGARITVRDDTALHANHNADVGHHGGHYKLTVVWDGFEGLTRVARQRHMMRVVEVLWGKGHIHALRLTLLTPEEAKTRQGDMA